MTGRRGTYAGTPTMQLSLEQIYQLSLAALRGSGASEGQAAPVADSIREAEAEGIRNVGLGYLPDLLRASALREGEGECRAAPGRGGAGGAAGRCRPWFLPPGFSAGAAPLRRDGGGLGCRRAGHRAILFRRCRRLVRRASGRARAGGARLRQQLCLHRSLGRQQGPLRNQSHRICRAASGRSADRRRYGLQRHGAGQHRSGGCPGRRGAAGLGLRFPGAGRPPIPRPCSPAAALVRSAAPRATALP